MKLKPQRQTGLKDSAAPMAALSRGLRWIVCARHRNQVKHLTRACFKAKTPASPVHAFGKPAPKSSDKKFKSFADSRLAALNKAACLQLRL
jgi:hypothetical protein